MKRATTILATASLMLLLALSFSWAQGGRRGGGGGGGISAEQLLGYLALSPDILLTDEQLLNARNALRASYARQMDMRRSGRDSSVDPVEMRKQMTEMQESMIAAVSALLTREQNVRLNTGLEQMGGGGGRGGRGGR